ncbi:MAG: hypothetical protein KC636_03665 [Myxococcales bacterium]|nr:hypothetical protein [Myxococcales bacterium]
MSARPRSAWIIALALACATSSPAETEDEATGEAKVLRALIDAAAWSATTPEDDPFAAHRPAEVDCGLAGWTVEGGILEIDTNYCDYVTLQQSSLVAVEVGDVIDLELGHFDLTAPAPTQAHYAVQLGEVVIWERELSIPRPGTVYRETITASQAFPAGAPVYVHLHNHGQNNYQLYRLDAEVRG